MSLKDRFVEISRMKQQLSDDGLPREITDQALGELKATANRATDAARAMRQILTARAEVAEAKEKAEAAEAKLRLLRVTADRRLAQAKAGGNGGPTGDVETAISDRAIQQLATKAVVKFAALPSAEAEQAWKVWRDELQRRFPAYAAAEVVELAMRLRELSR